MFSIDKTKNLLPAKGTLASKIRVWVINGPNLNLLGAREVGIYGSETLDNINAHLGSLASDIGVSVEFFQSNHEGELVDFIHQAAQVGVQGIVLNPAALTHTSISIRDALAAVSIPAIEVHLSNIYSREAFRSESLIAPVTMGQVAGLGALGYSLALLGLVDRLQQPDEPSSPPLH